MKDVLGFSTVLLLPVIFIFLGRWFLNWMRQAKNIVPADNGMMKISCNPSIFARFAKKEAYFYDSEYLYQVKNGITAKVHFSDILQIKPGFTTLNNRRKWSVIYLNHGQKKEFQFYHNITFFNHNFAGFLLAVKEANPAADVKALSAFNW
ncbi:hypothetical protein [Cronobacter muytjensii]|nr:hypothetical protein [Cronobacter muytjensii]